eukprot:468399-Amorphochlora_amoeboformis.AAC.1
MHKGRANDSAMFLWKKKYHRERSPFRGSCSSRVSGDQLPSPVRRLQLCSVRTGSVTVLSVFVNL